MDYDQSWTWREFREAFVWLIVPLLCLVAAGKFILSWLLINQTSVLTAVTLVGCLGIASTCWLVAKRRYAAWLMAVRQGVTASGLTVYQMSERTSLLQIFAQLGLLLLMTIFVLQLNSVFQPVLALLYGGLIWIGALATFMPVNRCIWGTYGLWVTYFGVKIYIPYASVNRVLLIEKTGDTRKFIVVLYRGNSAFRRFRLPMSLPKDAIRVLNRVVKLEIQNGQGTI